MSIDLLNRAWASNVDHTTQLLVLLSLADQANDRGLCWPSIEHVSKRARCSPRSVIRATNALAGAGHISIERKTGRGRANVYHVHPIARKEEGGGAAAEPARGEGFPWEKGDTVAPRKGDNLAPQNGRKGDSHDRKGDNGDRKGDTGVTPITKNHQEPPITCAAGASREGVRDLAFEALARAQGSDPGALTTREAGAIGKALSEIRSASPEVGAAEIATRAKRYRAIFPSARCTANALAKHWSACGGGDVSIDDDGSMPAPEHSETPEPEGWGEAFDSLYADRPGYQRPRRWSEVPVALIGTVLAEIARLRESRKKNEGGGAAE